MSKKSEQYDLVVIGCGAAGLSAAVSYSKAASEQGRPARVAVLERADRENRGGATRWTGSWFRITEDRCLDPQFIGQMEEVSGGMADLDYCRTLDKEIGTTLSFLEDNNVEVIYFKQPFPNRNTGDGLRMAMEAGGDTAGQFDMFHGEPADRRSDKPDAVVYAYPYGIVVNQQCRRFYDEGKDSFDSTFEEFSYEIWKNQNQRAYFIGDQTTKSVPNIDQIILTNQPPVTADTLKALAEKLELDAAALEKTVQEFNAAVGPGDFDPLVRDGKATTGIEPPKSNWAFPIEKPPYIAYPLTCAITFTFGGIRTDSRARVISPGGAAIPGLYAAGEVTGLYYHVYPVGTSVLRAATFGRLAGAHAVQSNQEKT